MLSGFFGALALLLAGLGLYGVTAYAVARRRTEIGIRMALGAPPAGVVRLVLARVAWLVGVGVAVGAAVSLWASTLIASLLYGLAPRDPVTFAGAAVTLTAVAALAGWLPAYRASRTRSGGRAAGGREPATASETGLRVALSDGVQGRRATAEAARATAGAAGGERMGAGGGEPSSARATRHERRRQRAEDRAVPAVGDDPQR